ncbi:MAG TPA: ABC transporter permease [Bryobacteraceae bacterium]|nr:ABC transporter permease [Bryobacteraceae bacterium]
MNLVTWLSGIRIALDSIRESKLRAFLTVLGVIIGTGTIIGVGSIISGLDGAITDVLRSFGPNTLIVFKFRGGPRTERLTPEELRRRPLSFENAVAIRERCPSVENVSPYLFPQRNNAFSKARFKGNEVYRVQLGGTHESYVANGTEMKYGRFFNDIENQRHMPVVAVGEDVASNLFPSIDPSGKWIEVNGKQVQVVGVMKRPAASMPGSADLRILFPYFAMRKMFPGAREHMILVTAKEGRLGQAMDEVRMVMRQERRDKYSDPDSFWISTAEQMVEQFHAVTGMVALVMIVMSSIGLLVGGIGVMNIMLVSVTERTREIGIRKAIGATRFDIILQFLTEAATLTFIGGLLGMAFGSIISIVARVVFPSLPTQVPLWAAFAGVAVSIGVGLFFGIWPASKAARLDPVVALRYE